MSQGSPWLAFTGVPYEAQVTPPASADFIQFANLPDGLSYDPSKGVISGICARPGNWHVHLLALKEGRAIAHSRATITVENTTLLGADVYLTAVTDAEFRASLPLTAPYREQAFVVNNLTAGVSYNSGMFRGAARRAGRFEEELRHAADQSLTGHKAILHVYERPSWEAERRRARRLPALSLFDVPKLVIPERYSPFSPEAVIRTTLDGVTWTANPLPPNIPKKGLIDVGAPASGYTVAGQNWWATTRNLTNYDTTTLSGFSIHALAAEGDLLVAATSGGLWRLGEESEPFELGGWQRSGVAIGNGRIIAVSEAGLVEVYDLAGTRISRDWLASFSLVHLKDIIFSEGEFIAVGIHGTVLRSIDGEHWIIDRAPRRLGADFRFVTANKDWIVAVAPWTAFGRRRDGGPWETLERVSVPGSFLAELMTTDGTRIGGYAEGLYVPRHSEAGVTVLSASCQTAIAGETFRYTIQALGGVNLTFHVEGLPEGVRFDAGRGEIHGQIAKPGLFQVLIEATDGINTHGKTLLIEVQSGPLRLLRHHFEIPAGSGPLTIPLSDARRTNVISDVGQVDYALGERWLSNFGETQPGEYRVRLRVKSGAGSMWETITVRVVEPKPFFLTQPVPLTTAEAGSAVALETELQGQWPITMQWYRNGKPVDGATEARLTIDVLSSETVGTYALRAVNVLGETVSKSAVVRLASDQTEAYATWAAARSLGPESHFEDHNRDGRANVFDYLLGDVSTSDAPRLVETPDGGRAFRFVRHRADDIDLVLQFSAELVNWQDIGPDELTIEMLPGERELATWPVPRETTAPRFLRFVASKR